LALKPHIKSGGHFTVSIHPGTWNASRDASFSAGEARIWRAVQITKDER
jgi:hypothetical protein